jgi:hypothetical protein
LTMYLDARKRCGISREVAIQSVPCSLGSMHDYEKGEVTPQPGTVLWMSRVYNAPELTQRYCREACEIGRAYGYDHLDNLDLSLPAVVVRMAVEMREAQSAINKLMVLTAYKQVPEDFAEAEWAELTTAIGELFDAEHTIEQFKLALSKMVDVSKLVESHNRKCEQKGFIKRRTAQLAAR